MTCTNCGSAAVDLVHETGGTEAGRFTEVHECLDCGAMGTIRGDAAAPASEWRRTGTLFTEDNQ